jgi:thiol-disulfide isomerase/thioredoxin
MDDYLKYETWNILLDYPGWHAQQNNIKQDSVQLSNSYYAFLQEYNMNDENILSTNHAHFLYSYYRYVIQHPKDSMNKANNYFKKRDIIPGANVLKNMILQKTSGFTKDMYLTRFYLDAIEGKQLKLFEAVYDSTDLTHSFFTNIINREYVQLQKFIANQDTKGAHLITISSTTAGNLLDTIIAPYPNKVIYIDFWATWCSPCLAEIPYSKTLQQDYRNKDVVFLFLANRCAEDAWKATIANKELTGEHILLTTDQYNTLAAELNITGIPYYVLIDKKGNITAQNAPRPSAEKEIRSQIDNLLQ